MVNYIRYAIAVIAAAVFMASAYFYPAETFIAFVVGWVFLIPVAAVLYMVYGALEYMKERKHRITVEVKPTRAMKALARREEELKKEKDLLYAELNKGIERD